MAQALLVPKPWPDPHYIIAAPTVGQAKNIAWNDVKALIPKSWVSRITESRDDMRIVTKWGADLRVVGLDKPARVEGAPIDGIWITEWANCKAGIWEAHIRLALADRAGWAIIEGTPDFEQENNIEYERMYNRSVKIFDDGYDLEAITAEFLGEDYDDEVSAEDLEAEGVTVEETKIDTQWVSCVWSSETVLPEEEIESMKDMDPLYALQEMHGQFVSAPGRAYPRFSEAGNVGVNKAAYVPDKIVYVGCDFNFGHHNWIVGQLIPNDDRVKAKVDPHLINDLRIFDQVYLQNADVDEMCEKLRDMMKSYGISEKNLVFTGDIQGGRQRAATATRNAWEIIEANFPAAAFEYFRTNPPVSDSLRETNKYICNAKRIRRLCVHPRAEELRKDLRYVTRTQLLKQDKTGDRTHAGDCLRYLIWYFERIK